MGCVIYIFYATMSVFESYSNASIFCHSSIGKRAKDVKKWLNTTITSFFKSTAAHTTCHKWPTRMKVKNSLCESDLFL